MSFVIETSNLTTRRIPQFKYPTWPDLSGTGTYENVIFGISVQCPDLIKELNPQLINRNDSNRERAQLVDNIKDFFELQQTILPMSRVNQYLFLYLDWEATKSLHARDTPEAQSEIQEGINQMRAAALVDNAVNKICQENHAAKILYEISNPPSTDKVALFNINVKLVLCLEAGVHNSPEFIMDMGLIHD